MSIISHFIDYLRKQNQPSKRVNINLSNYNFNTEKIKSFEASLPIDLKRNIQKSNITPPNFAMFWNFYQNFPPIQNVVGKIADRVASIGGRWEDKDGNIIKNTEIDYTNFIKEFLIHFLVYGQVVILNSKIENNDKWIFVPSHQVTLWAASGYNINSFVWYWEQSLVNVTDSKQFKIYKEPNINSIYFGKSRLNSFYNDLNISYLDYENYLTFLKNNSFPGSFFKLKDNISPEEIKDVLETILELSKPEGKFKGLADNKIEEIIQIKQDLANKLTVEEKDRIERLVYNAYSYPYDFINPRGGLGRGEQTSLLLNMRDEIIVFLQKTVAKAINDIQGKLDDIVWIPNEMDLTTKTENIETGIKAFESGLTSAKETKIKFMGYKPKDTNEDDNRYKFKNNDVIIQEGRIFEPLEAKTFEIAEPETKNYDQIKAIPKISLKQALQEKKDIEQLLKSTNRDFSKIEIVLNTPQARNAKTELRKAFFEINNQINYQKIFKKLQTGDKIKSDSELNIIKQELEKLPNLSQTLDINILAKYLSFVSQFGRQDAINNLKELDIEMSENDKTFIGAEISEYIKNRTENLLGFNNQTPKSDTEPFLENGLDNYTIEMLATIILKMWLAKNEIDKALVAQIKQAINNQTIERIEMIIESETARAMNTGFATVAIFAAKQKDTNLGYEWIKTTSMNPDINHLALVGKIAPINNTQSVWGNNFPGTRPNCKCSLKIIKL